MKLLVVIPSGDQNWEKSSWRSVLPALSVTRKTVLTASITSVGPTATISLGGRHPQGESSKLRPSKLVPSVAPLGFWIAPSDPAQLVVARLLGRGDVLGGRVGLVRLGAEVGPAWSPTRLNWTPVLPETSM